MGLFTGNREDSEEVNIENPFLVSLPNHGVILISVAGKTNLTNAESSDQ